MILTFLSVVTEALSARTTVSPTDGVELEPWPYVARWAVIPHPSTVRLDHQQFSTNVNNWETLRLSCLVHGLVPFNAI